MKIEELGRHVGKSCQTVGMQILVLEEELTAITRPGRHLILAWHLALRTHSHPGHVDLNCSYNYKDQQTAQTYLGENALRVPGQSLDWLESEQIVVSSTSLDVTNIQTDQAYHSVNGFIENVVFAEN